jgi:type I restriction enzyme S subunit
MTGEAGGTLPSGWSAAEIGDLFDSWGGHTPSKANKEYWGPGLPWISSKDVKTARQTTSTYTVTDRAVTETGLRVCPPGSVLVVVRSGILAHSLPVSVTEMPVTINQDLKAFHSEEPLMNQWLALFLRMTAHELLAASRRDGTTVQSVQYPLLKRTLMPVPPVEERRRIITAVHDLLAKHAAIPSRILAARQILRRFRQAVLIAACSGRLTADWRDLHPIAEASAESIVLAIDKARRDRLGGRYRPTRPSGTQSDLPEGWCWTTVGALVDVGTGATPLRSRADYYGGSVPWVTSGAVNAGLITRASEFISERAIRETNAKVFPPGTLLVAMYGEGQTRGRVGELAFEAATNQAVAALLFDQRTEALRPYLKIFLQENYERIRRLSFGGVQPNLSLGAIRDTALPLPPSMEQAEIVSRVSRLLEVASRLDQRIDAASRMVDRCSQAILAKAFRGELPGAVRNGSHD